MINNLLYFYHTRNKYMKNNYMNKKIIYCEKYKM